ncbi:beta-ribofuranosylaminobenzene 5'-phosphate synthase family protein [Candidatus Altiarchaeota archaeon]
MKLTVSTPSRLHLGVIDYGVCEGKRRYGGFGVALEQPGFVLGFQSSDSLIVAGSQPERVKEIVEKFGNHFNFTPKATITVKEAIPPHIGLGSGTQLALAVAQGLSAIHDIKVPLDEIAGFLGRGGLSKVGIRTFERGGFISDTLTKEERHLFRHEFPEEWAFVLVLPREVKERISGSIEDELFRQVDPKPELMRKINRILEEKVIPSLSEKDISSFGEGLTETDKLVGQYFSPAQKGEYLGEHTSQIINNILEVGCYGAGQSSWGPVVYGLAKKEEAPRVAKDLGAHIKEKGINAEIWTSTANNMGAQISTEST